jgi:DNA repair exonuclease SbcCD ATPase subunit
VQEELPSVVVVPVDVLQSLLQEVHSLREEVQDLKEKIAALDAQQLQDIENLAIDIAHDRQRITKLEAIPEPEPKEPSQKVAEHLEEIAKALSAKRASMPVHWPEMGFHGLLGGRGASRREPSQS